MTLSSAPSCDHPVASLWILRLQFLEARTDFLNGKGQSSCAAFHIFCFSPVAAPLSPGWVTPAFAVSSDSPHFCSVCFSRCLWIRLPPLGLLSWFLFYGDHCLMKFCFADLQKCLVSVWLLPRNAAIFRRVFFLLFPVLSLKNE